MGHTNKTTKFQLPQFVKTDKPQMTDFNDAFKNIDNKVVSKAGDTMNGDFYINKLYPTILLGDSGGKYAQTFIQNANHITWITTRNDIGDNSNYRGIIVGDSESYTNLKNAVRAVEKKNGGAVQYYNLYGEHNKPNGSYTGNGSATQRTIDTGALGGTIRISGSTTGVMAILTPAGGIIRNGSSVVAVASSEASFENGVLKIALADKINVNNETYYYQVM